MNDPATHAQIVTITRDVIAGRAASGSYLQLLVVAVQGALGDERGKRLTLDAVGAVHESFYATVLGAIGDAVSPVERNRRATFARSACSTLRQYVRAGGRLQSLDPLSVSKVQLRAYARPVAIGTPREKAFQRAVEATGRSAAALAKDSPSAARARLRGAIATLQAQLAKITAAPATGKRLGKRAPHRAVTVGQLAARRSATVHRVRAH